MSLQIRTFGGFKLTSGGTDKPALSLRSGKMWDVLKYLITYRAKQISAEKLTEALWPSEDIPDPTKSLADIVYRLRKALVSCGGSQKCIGFAQNGYYWNPDTDCRVDAEEFEAYINNAHDINKSVEERVVFYKQAIELYRGEYLEDSVSLPWATGFVNYYRRLFLQAVEELSAIYEKRYEFDEIILLCNKAIVSEPLEESLYIIQINAFIMNGEYQQAKRQYKHIKTILKREFNAKPSRTLQNLAKEINKAFENQTDDINEIKKNLDQINVQKNVFFCGPETFRQLYLFDKRSEERIQFPVFLCALAIRYDTEQENEDELKSAMKLLRKIMLRTLRQGDVISQYSSNQFLMMISAVNEYGGKAALNRIKRIFENEYGKDGYSLMVQVTPAGSGQFTDC